MKKLILYTFIYFTSQIFAQGSDVTFNLTIDAAHDGGDTYNNLFASGDGFDDRFVIGFNLSLTELDGEPVSIGPIAAFCSEIQEPIGIDTFTFEAAQLRQLARGRAGDPGTASENIPVGGIGNLRAARLAYLFDQYYTSETLTAWDQTTADPTLHAFQLATWEVTHDTDLDLSDTGGSVYIGAQSGGDTTLRNNAISLAQTYLDDVDTAGVTTSYTSSLFDFWALTSETGNGAFGFQDVILATGKEFNLDEEILVPEPGTLVLASIFLLSQGAFLMHRKRKSE